MIIDKGMGLWETEAWLELNGDYVDLCKLTFGTSVFYPSGLLARKTARLRRAGIKVLPGGTLAEVAMIQGKWREFLSRADRLGFDAIEVSDGTIMLGAEEREQAIAAAKSAGFTVLGEVGKKDPRSQPGVDILAAQALADLAAGADMVIVEGRESGKNVGIFDPAGEVRADSLELLAAQLPPAQVIWEAPLKTQQEELILRFGPNVNLGNIPPGDVLALEALRTGLRGDTLKSVLVFDFLGETSAREMISTADGGA